MTDEATLSPLPAPRPAFRADVRAAMRICRPVGTQRSSPRPRATARSIDAVEAARSRDDVGSAGDVSR